MRRHLLALTLGLAASLHVAPLNAQRAEYSVDNYTTERGLPSQSVTSIAQTNDGFLWLAVGGMLARSDGHQFFTYTARQYPALFRRVNMVHAGLGDTVWVLLEGNSVVAAVGATVVQVIPPTEETLLSIAQDGTGQLFAAGYATVWQLGRHGERSTPVEPRIALAGTLDHPIQRDNRGRLWITDSSNALRQIGSRGVASRPTGNKWDNIATSAAGDILAVRQRGLVADVVREDGEVAATYQHTPDTEARLIDRDGRLWVTIGSRYDVYERGNTEPVARIPNRTNGVDTHMVTDRSGCVWSGEFTLLKLCRAPFQTVTERLPSSIFSRGPGGIPIVWDGVRIIAGSLDGGAPRPLFGERHASNDVVYVDHHGVWWVASDSLRASVKAIAPTATVHVIPHRAVTMVADHPRRAAEIWYGGKNFIYHAEATASGVVVRDSVSAPGRLTQLAPMADGSVWAALRGAGAASLLMHVQGSRARTYSSRDGLPAAELRALLADDDGTVWLGTYGGGLVRFRNGQFRAVTESDGLSEDVVTSILEDGHGNFWMGGNRGVHRVSRAEVEQFLERRVPRVHGVAYTRADGLKEPETTGAFGMRDDAGRLWFPTIGGTVVVDPAFAIALDSVPPQAYVLGLRTERDTVNDGRAPVRLTRGARRLIVRYTATSVRNDNGVRFEYRIDDIDKDWVAAGSAREVTYDAMQPGTHTFRVRAFNSGGVMSARDATMEFTVPPFFYETPAFTAVMLIGAATLGWMGIKYRERRLRANEAVLATAVQERTAELQTALATLGSQAEQLRALDEAKSRFFANVSHEFRTPLSLIIGPAEDLRDGRFGEMPAVAQRRLDSVLANARRLLQLVDQLLDIARLQSGTLHLVAETRDLVPLLRHLADSLASLAERQGIDFRLSCPAGTGLRVRYDADQMEKIVSNLVGNALKFTQAGGSVELRAAAVDGWAVIEVEDNGPGIAPEYHERVFERFFQIDDSSRRAHEGAGIGLALVRDLVELHRGSVAVRSEPGSGSTFIVRLPLVAGELPRAEMRAMSPVRSMTSVKPRSSIAPGADVTTVLVVEDNIELLEFLREHLSDQYRVIVAENGVRGLEMAREHLPDLVVSDVMMPLMDGQALCEAIKGDPDIDFIPVILLTAKASRDARLAGLAGGADDYLTKPVDLAELSVRAENLIASRRRVRERFRAANHPLPSISIPIKGPPRDASARALVESLSLVMADHVSDEDFDVDAMAAALVMGRSTLYRKLHGVLGVSPMDAMWEYRLTQAAQWLSETPITVSEVAYGVGFKSVPHFCGRFRDRFGVTPSEYRRDRSSETG